MQILTAGANAAAPDGDLTLLVRRTAGASVDVSALLAGPDGRVASDADFVFYNQPAAADGAVQHLVGPPGQERIVVHTAAVPASVERIVVAGSVDTGTFAGVTGLRLELQDAYGAPVAAYDVEPKTNETVLVLGELYRRQGHWKLRAVGQGYDTGLAGLAADYGVTIEEDASPVQQDKTWSEDPTMRLPLPADDPQLAGLPTDMGVRVSLRKEAVRVCLEKKGIGGVRARVALVLDRSGSMRKLYASGSVGDIVERMAPIAARLDDDGELDAWVFADDFVALPTLRMPELAGWIDDNVYINAPKGEQLPRRADGSLRKPDRLSSAWGGNNEPLVIKDLIDRYTSEPGAPVLVLFFSDGGVTRSKQITKLLTEAASLPLFWQFIGLGQNEYGVLEKFDTMEGRVVDNAGFFCVDDIDKITDAELYDRILNEFPQWLTDARAKGIVR
jgi:stress response protein SCP2